MITVPFRLAELMSARPPRVFKRSVPFRTVLHEGASEAQTRSPASSAALVCPPVLATATLMMGVMQAVMQHQAQQQQRAMAQQVADRETQRCERDVVNAQGANRQEHAALNRRAFHERDAVLEKDRIGAGQVAKARGYQAAVTGEVGVTGISVDDILADIARGETSNRAVREANYLNTAQQIRDEQSAADARAAARINSLQPGVNTAPEPSVLGLVAGIGGAGLQDPAWVRRDG